MGHYNHSHYKNNAPYGADGLHGSYNPRSMALMAPMFTVAPIALMDPACAKTTQSSCGSNASNGFYKPVGPHVVYGLNTSEFYGAHAYYDSNSSYGSYGS